MAAREGASVGRACVPPGSTALTSVNFPPSALDSSLITSAFSLVPFRLPTSCTRQLLHRSSHAMQPWDDDTSASTNTMLFLMARPNVICTRAGGAGRGPGASVPAAAAAESPFAGLGGVVPPSPGGGETNSNPTCSASPWRR